MAMTLTMDNDDCFGALMDRGAYLRKLRELEAQDEAERQAAEDQEQGNDAPISSDTLHYESAYLQGQHYYDDYKHVNYRFIDFGYVSAANSNSNDDEHIASEEDKENANSNKPQQQQQQQQQQVHNEPLPLMIEQDRTVGKGGFVWDAGFILAEHVLHEQEEWKASNKPVSMVELGAGTGITGLYVASAMPSAVHMSLTDLPELMPLLQKNLVHNPQANATAFPLAWGTNVQGNYDVILGADVVAGIYDPVKLAKTIYDLCHDTTKVYLAVNTGRLAEIVTEFQDAMGPLFESIEIIRQPMSRNKNPNVSIFVATGKRSNQ